MFEIDKVKWNESIYSLYDRMIKSVLGGVMEMGKE